MSKLKMPVRSPSIDMTPMVDLFFLLLTFFMLTTTFRPQEPVPVTTPVSISEKVSPENNIITLLISYDSVSNDSKVFFNVDNGADTSMHIRAKLLTQIGEYYGVKFTKIQIKKFEKMAGFGLPIKYLPAWINAADDEARKALFQEIPLGIPMDSTDNQLAMWILFSRKANPKAEAAIKGDSKADYKVVKKVFDILLDKNISKFNLTTDLEKVQVNSKEIQ